MSYRLLSLPFVVALMVGCDSRTPDASPEAKQSSSETDVTPASSRSLAELAEDSVTNVKVKLRGDAIATADLRAVTDAAILNEAVAAAADEGVEEVLLQGEIVTDEIVAPLVKSESLKRFRAESTSLGDDTLAVMAEGNRIELLYFIGATELTEAGVTHLENMTSLRNLRIGGDAVNDSTVAAVAFKPRLGALGLLHCKVTDKGVTNLTDLKSLKELMLFNTPVTDACYASIAKLPNLQTLRLRQTKITGENAEGLKSVGVVELELAETNFGNAGMDAIRTMPNLERVNFWLTKIDNDGVAKLRGMTQLTSLNLDNLPPVDDEAIATITTLPNLDFLHLGKTRVTADGLKQLAPLKKLKTLLATQLGVTDDEAKEIRKAIPSLERFDYQD